MTTTTTEAPLDPSVVPAVWSRYTDIEVDHGSGSWLTAVNGRRYLDYSSGIGVTSTGHAHPRVVAAIAEQAASLIHGQQNIVYHRPGLRLHARLAGLAPHHFARWLQRWESTVDSLFTGDRATEMKQRAHHIATVFQVKLGLDEPTST